MKIYLILFFAILFGSCSTKRNLKISKVELTDQVIYIPFKFIKDFCFVEVEINHKKYNFLFDTGAPTLISNEIFKSLNLTINDNVSINDSQDISLNMNKTTLNEMIFGNVIFRDIDCFVGDFETPEMKCLSVDGILGANQMAGLIWEINYKDQIFKVSKNIENFDLNGFDFIIPFRPLKSKTPAVNLNLFNKDLTLSFDTGSNDGIAIFNKMDTTLKNQILKTKHFESKGINSLGFLNVNQNSKFFTFQPNSIKIGNKTIFKPIINTSNSTTIGNEFLKNYIFILDWNKNQIYLKQISEPKNHIDNYSFSYRILPNNTEVVNCYEDEKDLKLGDTIVSINNVNLENLGIQKSCEYFKSGFGYKIDTMEVVIRRKDSLLHFTKYRKQYF